MGLQRDLINSQAPPAHPPSEASLHIAACTLGTQTSELPVSICTLKSWGGVPTEMLA